MFSQESRYEAWRDGTVVFCNEARCISLYIQHVDFLLRVRVPDDSCIFKDRANKCEVGISSAGSGAVPKIRTEKSQRAVGLLCDRGDVLRTPVVGSELDAKLWVGSDLL